MQQQQQQQNVIKSPTQIRFQCAGNLQNSLTVQMNVCVFLRVFIEVFFLPLPLDSSLKAKCLSLLKSDEIELQLFTQLELLHNFIIECHKQP